MDINTSLEQQRKRSIFNALQRNEDPWQNALTSSAMPVTSMPVSQKDYMKYWEAEEKDWLLRSPSFQTTVPGQQYESAIGPYLDKPKQLTPTEIAQQKQTEYDARQQATTDQWGIMKPIWTVTGEDLKTALTHTWNEFLAGTARTSASVSNVLDASFATGFNLMESGENLLRLAYSKVTKTEYKPITIASPTVTKYVTTLLQKGLGVKPFSEQYKGNDQTVKNVLKDIDEGTNILTGMSQRSQNMFQGRADQVADRVEWGNRIASKVVGTLPQMSIMALPHGQVIFSLAAFSGAIGDVTDKGQISQKDMEYALYSASIEVASEMIFGLFGNSEALVSGALSKMLGKATKPTVAMLIRGVAMQGFEEGLEEMIAFPFQLYLDWKYKNPDAPFSSYVNWQTAREWGEAGLVGFLAGALMSAPQAYNSAKLNKAEKAELKQHVNNVLNNSADKITPETAEAIADLTAKALDPNAPSIEGESDSSSYAAMDISKTFEQLMQSAEEADAQTMQQEEPVSRIPFPEAVQARTSPAEAQVVSEPIQTVQEPSTPPAPVTTAIPVQEAPAGKTVKANLAVGKQVDTTVKAVPVSAIISSIDADLNPVAGYDQALQPRATDRQATEVTVAEITNKPDFNQLIGTETVQEGMPVIGANGMVVAGNHRVAGILRMMRDNPKAYARYKQYIKSNAEQLGLDPASLTGDFIVTQVLPEGVNLEDIGDKSNIPTVRKMSPSEYAKRDSHRLTQAMLSLFVANETGMINTLDNRAFIREFMDKIVPTSERDSYMDADYNINQDGVSRIRNAVFFNAYGSTKLLDLIAESTDNNVKRLTTSLVNVAPKIVALKDGIASGIYYNIDVPKVISQAAERWVRMKQTGENVMLFAKQVELGDSAETIRAKNLLLAMDANKASALRLTAFYNDLIDTVIAAGDPRQTGLFAVSEPKLDDIINVAMKGGNYGEYIETELEEVKQEPDRPTELESRSRERIAEAPVAVPQEPKPEPKVAQEKAKAEPSAYVEESQKQDTSHVQGIVSPAAQNTMGGVPAQAQSWEQMESLETAEAIEKAQNFAQGDTVIDKLKEFAKGFRSFTTLGSVPIDVKFGDVRRVFRLMRTADAQSRMKAEKIVAMSYNTVGKEKLKLMQRAILYLDAIEDIRRGMYKSGEAMQFNWESPEQVIKIANAIVADLKKPENSLVLQALKTRQKLMNEVRQRLIAKGSQAGLDLSYLNDRKSYMYHAVLEYQHEFNHQARNQSKKRIEYLGRTGSIKDYISDPAMTDWMILRKMVRDTTRIDLYLEMKKHDIKSTVPTDPITGEHIIPDGYAELDPSMIGMPDLDTYSKVVMIANAKAHVALQGWSLQSPEGKRYMKQVIHDANKHVLVVPSQFADAVTKEFGKKESNVGNFMKKATNIWKYSKIRMPNVVIRYNIRNFFGDLDAVLAGRPSAVLSVPKAIKELYGFYYRSGKVTQDLQEYIDKTGLTTGQTAQNLKSLKHSKIIDVYIQPNGKRTITKKAIKKVWSAITMETATDYREQILRYAAYLSFRGEMANSANNLPANYAASIPIEIQSIADYKDRAAKMANDLVGAYDDVSLFGQYVADHIVPFFRFKEVNIKRYYRLYKNALSTDPVTIQNLGNNTLSSIGKVGKVGAFTVYKIGKLALGTMLFYSAISMFNNLVAPDEEDELSEDIKSRPHIVLPRWMTGDDRVLYFDRLGSFAELLDVFGFDYGLGNDLRDIATGRMTYQQKIQEMIMAPAYDVFNGSSPFFKMTAELLAGQQYFPDPSNPKAIRDRWEYVFGQVGLKDEYKALVGKPLPDGSYSKQKQSIIMNSVIPGESAFWDVYDYRDKYYKAIEKSSTYTAYRDRNTEEYKRANAAYYYKMALRMNDTKAAEQYLVKYVAYGGTSKTFDATMRSMHPLSFMSKADAQAFRDWLNPEEQETLDKAIAYYKSLQSLKATTLP